MQDRLDKQYHACYSFAIAFKLLCAGKFDQCFSDAVKSEYIKQDFVEAIND